MFQKSGTFSFLIKPTLYLLPFLFLFSCGEEKEKSAFENCKYGAPEAIFKTAHPTIKTHSFDLTKKAGIEKLQFSNGIHLEIIQTGCDNIKQEYKYTLAGDFKGQKEKDFWVNKSIEQFRYLANISNEYAVFGLWANAIEEQIKLFKLGQSIEIDRGTFVSIDKIISHQSTLLLITTSNN